MDLTKKIKNFPDTAGVYLMKDALGTILYIGKASSLKKRVGSYFQRPGSAKIQALLGRVKNIDHIQTVSSAQALLLENSLIKKFKPYYNAALKDDKSYPYIKINTKESFPAVSIVRGKKEKVAHYYGPYTNAKLLKSAVKAIRIIFPFRSCIRLPKRPCLYLDLKLCPGMCIKKIGKNAYQENLKQLELFLKGNYKELLAEVTYKMHQKAKNELFEEAVLLRDKVNALTQIINQEKQVHPGELLGELARLLGLLKVPQRIEAFDISEISGSGLCGAMISFVGGWPDKSNYRKFRIKTVKGVDDYAMMREVLRRRYSGKELSKIPLPDLVLIDGGKGHLSCACDELNKLGLGKMPVIALAKRQETIYTQAKKTINLPHDSKVLHLLQRIRNEVHRFAISYHRKLRQKTIRTSSLDKITGIGPKRKQLLLRHFQSIDAIKKASLQDLLKLERIDKRTAKNIVKHFR